MAISAPIGIRAAVLEALRTKSGIAAAAMLGFLILLAILVPVLAPYNIVQAWNDPTAWGNNPKLAAPEWSEIFSGKHLPRTILLPYHGEEGGFDKVRVSFNVSSETYTLVVLKKTFSYQYDAFPSEISLMLKATFGNKSATQIKVFWDRPDGQTVHLFDANPSVPAPDENTYSLTFPNPRDPSYSVYQNIEQWLISQNITNETEWSVLFPRQAGPYSNPPDAQLLLMARLNRSMLNPETAEVLKGNYSFRIEFTGFTATDDANARAVIYGTVYGLAGTDINRRDLLVAVLWGAPVALAFGLVGAFAAVLIQTILGAISGWYGGAIDEFVQRAADFYLIIPTLPILILLGILYRPGILLLLFVLVVFGVVGATTKVIRSIVLQVKEEQFIEAARSYGASRRRILFRYIMPRVMPYTFALIALTVPAFIFLEASLSFLGLGDPSLPTWGHILGDAYSQGALFASRAYPTGFWWWILFPAMGIIFTTVAFALLGYAFDKVLNPRLREQ